MPQPWEGRHPAQFGGKDATAPIDLEPAWNHSEAGEDAWQRGFRALEEAETLSAYLQGLEQISQSRFAGDDRILSAAKAVMNCASGLLHRRILMGKAVYQ